MHNLCDSRMSHIDLAVAGRLFIHLHNELMRDRGKQACFVMNVIAAIVIVSALISIK